MISALRAIWQVFLHAFRKRETIQYPEKKVYLAPRYRGRIVLSRDPDGEVLEGVLHAVAGECARRSHPPVLLTEIRQVGVADRPLLG